MTMSLSERLKKKCVRARSVVIDGDVYNVKGLSKRARGELFAKARRKDLSLNTDVLESLLLSACVSDEAEDYASKADWDDAPSDITGPLVKVIMQVCGMDSEDLADPKDSDATQS